MKISYRTDCDVLVIGAGGAGIKAAIKAAEAGCDVLLVNKFQVGVSGSTFYPRLQSWGMNSVTNPCFGDSEDAFYEEILEAGQGAIDKAVARTLAEQSTPVRIELEKEYGLHFHVNPETGRYYAVIPCFGKLERGSSCSMKEFKASMWQRMMRDGVRVRTGIDIASLVMHDGAVCGALGFDEKRELVFFRAKSVFMGTGGADAIYKYSLATPDQTGDGYVMAFDSGAELMNMEFIQFIPGITWPVKKFLFQEKPLDTIPSLTNRYGEEILAKYLPADVSVEECLTERAKHGPFSTVGAGRYFDIAMFEEWRAGHAFDDDGIMIRYPESIRKDNRFYIQNALKWLNDYGIDPIDEGMHILPHSQCFNGGIHINSKAETTLPGLFAGGESAGGPHGADRMGGNALAGSQVFGGIGGESAAAWAKKQSFVDIGDGELLAEFEEKMSSGNGRETDLKAAIAEVRDVMWNDAGISRSGERFEDAFERIQAVSEEFDAFRHFETGNDIRNALGLHSYLRLAELMLTAMNERKDSRGPHYRLDYPVRTPEFEGYIALCSDGEKIKAKLVRTD